MKKRQIVMILPPSKDLKLYGYRTSVPEEEMEQMKRGYMSEERLALNVCEPCPVCGERNYHSFYEKKDKRWNLSATKRGKLPDEIDTSKMSCGLVKSEKEIKRLFSKDRYYISEYVCLTCGSSYRSIPYRKQKYVCVKK